MCVLKLQAVRRACLPCKGEGLAPLVSDASVHSSRAAIRAACATATSRLVLAPPPSPAAHSPAIPCYPRQRCSRPDPTSRTPNSSSPNHHPARRTLALPLLPLSQGKGMEAIPYYERSLLLRRDLFGLHSSQVSSVCKRLVLLYNSWSMKVHAWMKREG